MLSPKDVETFLAAYPREVRDVALAARNLLRKAVPGATETLEERAKIIGYGYAPGYKGLVCTLMLSRAGVKVGIVRGSELPDPNGLLQGSGKVHRHVALKSVADLKQPALKRLLKTAVAPPRRAGNLRPPGWRRYQCFDHLNWWFYPGQRHVAAALCRQARWNRKGYVAG